MLAARSPVVSISSLLSLPLAAAVLLPSSVNGKRSSEKKPASSGVSGLQLGRGGRRTMRAKMRSEEKSMGVPASPSSNPNGYGWSSMDSLNSAEASRRVIEVRAVVKIRKKTKLPLVEMVEDQWESIVHGNGKGPGFIIRLVSEDIDPDSSKTGKWVESRVSGRLPAASDDTNIVECAADFSVQRDFGRPGAVIFTNLHRKELFVYEIVIHGFDEGPIFFPVNSWIHSREDNKESRKLFSNKAYLPSQTPAGLKQLRQQDLISLRGNGEGERNKLERVYDYAPYNDLGNPDKHKDLARPLLGGAQSPYPRRCRTGRPSTITDPMSESRTERPHFVYVPRDEVLEETKEAALSAAYLKAVLRNLVTSLLTPLSSSDNSFPSFSEIDNLYHDGIVSKHEGERRAFDKLLLMPKVVLNAGQRLLKFETPAIISRDQFAWLHDDEFARQMLAGLNPVNIERLKELPILSKLDPAIFGPPESAITKESLHQELKEISVEEAIKAGRLFILDYHDILLPFINKINSLKGRKAYASRTVLFLNQEDTLTPIAIELTLPPTATEPQKKHLSTRGHYPTAHWIWDMAKTHVCSNDAGIHQLVSHWLRTHACMEPYIIATHRQLSTMHPIHKLLHPHMRYTLAINALARENLLNGGGFVEDFFSPGQYSMELSSAAYKSMWRFDMEALPANLIHRGMAIEDPLMPCGVRLVIEDYPYAADGLLIWSAVKDWVEDYVSHFYSDPNSVTSDCELQAWWAEIKNKGHHDKRNEPWWPELKTKEDLSQTLATMIWTASGQHAALNFGQYPFGGYVPNRPALMRKLIPQKDEPEFENFLLNPHQTFLSSLPTQLQATNVMAAQEILSTHSPDEEYLGQMQQSLPPRWISDGVILKSFRKFSDRLMEIEQIIHARNKDIRLKNRHGAGVAPYELLLPTSRPGVTSRGIPNSISI